MAAPTKQDYDDLIDRMNVATSKVATVIRDLKAKLESGGLSPDEESAIHAKLGLLAEQLDALGADSDEPVPDDTGDVEPTP